MKKLILLSSITLVVSLLAAYFLIAILNSSGFNISVIAVIVNEITTSALAKLLFTSLLYFSLLIILPFLSTEITRWLGLKKSDFWKLFISLELLVLAFSYLSTPPDMTSTILMFAVCQLIVIVNIIAFWKTLNQKKA
ncbi:hypothetical protein [Spongiivirga citrea]|uniref:Uncharacterized protein n=1 Tax=Spongiivirga citrea TaxID=1481457 RepID=A0A6M0CJB1_9FLAO|nr:hypothetical protein [Spongiivirga citrea]NER17672.1 hypothetical protein [Spongiivirga citrea]